MTATDKYNVFTPFINFSIDKTQERMDKRPNYMTVPVALKDLEKIEMVRQYDGVYRLDHAVT